MSKMKSSKEMIVRMAQRMARRGAKNINPNDSDALREYTRTDESTGKKMYSMPEGTYKNMKGKYIKQEDKHSSVIHG